MPVPLINVAQVVNYAPNNGGINVVLKTSVTGPTFTVKMTYDYADALRIKQTPLPTLGSWGIVCFPMGDIRNGFWMRTILINQQSAISAYDEQTDPFLDYEAHWSGWWRELNAEGQETTVFPDGSSILIGPGTEVPQPNRFGIEDNAKTRQPFTQAERVATTPTPFSVTINMSSGLKVSFDADGSLSIDLPGAETFNVTQGGQALGDTLALVSKLVEAFNAHTHGGVQAGGSTTATPTTPWTAGTVESAIFDISN